MISRSLGRLSTRRRISFWDPFGIQTLYDRYLIVDKTRQPIRRIETPQFFWMRVAMGLFIQEERVARMGSSPLQSL